MNAALEAEAPSGQPVRSKHAYWGLSNDGLGCKVASISAYVPPLWLCMLHLALQHPLVPIRSGGAAMDGRNDAKVAIITGRGERADRAAECESCCG